MEDSNIQVIRFKLDRDVSELVNFSIWTKESVIHSATLFLYGAVVQDGKTLAGKDYTKYLVSGRDATRDESGNLVWPLIQIKWIPESLITHGGNEFIFTYNCYSESKKLLGHRRYMTNIRLERE